MPPHPKSTPTPSSQNHSQQSNKTKQQQLQSKLDRASSLETKLSKPSDETLSSKLRIQLCEIFSDILLTSPSLAARKDVCGRLWRSCFYVRIGELRGRISKEKSRLRKMQKRVLVADDGSGGGGGGGGGEDGEVVKQGKVLKTCEDRLKVFIEEAVVLYQYLVDQFQEIILPPSPSQSQSQPQSTPSNQPGVIPTLHRLYIYLGDLYRYISSYNSAETAYLRAARLAPGKGNPYNQLAVVAQLKDSGGSHPLPAVALYWYCRSLLAVDDAFETSRSNVERLFLANRKWLQQKEQEDGAGGEGKGLMEISTVGTSREKGRAVRSAASRKFLSLFCDFHGGLFSAGSSGKDGKKDEEKRDFEKERDSLISQFGMLLVESAFGDALLFKMVSINAFSIWNCLSEGSSSDNDGTMTGIIRTAAAISFAFEYGAQLSVHTEKSIQKVEDKIQQQQQQHGSSGGGLKISSGVRLIGPLLMLCEFLSYMSKRNKEMTDLRASLSSSDRYGVTVGEDPEDSVRKMFFQSERVFWSAISNLSQVLKNSDYVSELLKRKIKRGGGCDNDDYETDRSAIELPSEFKSLTRGYGPFTFFDRDQLEDNEDVSPMVSIADLMTNKKTPSSSEGGIAVDTYLTFEEAVEALELYPASSSRSSSSSSQSSQRSSKKSSNNHHRDDSKSVGQTEVQTRWKLSRFVRFIARHLDIVDVETVKKGTSTLLPHDQMDTGGSDVSQEGTDMDLDSQTKEEITTINNDNSNEMLADDDDMEEDILVYKENGNGPALLVPGALLVSSNEKQVNNHKLPQHQKNKLNSASGLLDLSTLLNQNTSNECNTTATTTTTIPKNKSAPTFATTIVNDDDGHKNIGGGVGAATSHPDLTLIATSPPPMPQSSSPLQADAPKLTAAAEGGGGGAVLRPPPGFNNTDKPLNTNLHNVHHLNNSHLLNAGIQQQQQPTNHQRQPHHLLGGGQSLYNRNPITEPIAAAVVATTTPTLTPFTHNAFQRSGVRHDAYTFPPPPSGMTNDGSSVQRLSRQQPPPPQTSNPFAYPMPPLGNGNNRFQELNLPAPTSPQRPSQLSSLSLINGLTTTPPTHTLRAAGEIPAYLGGGMNFIENHNANGTTATTTATMTPADLNMDLGNDLFGLRSLGLFDDNVGKSATPNVSSYFVGSDAPAQTKNPYV